MEHGQFDNLGGVVKGVEGDNRQFSTLRVTLIKNMKIWCKIKLIIYIFLLLKDNNRTKNCFIEIIN